MDMKPVTCPTCQHTPMHPVWAVDPEQKFRGWWCPECNHFVKPMTGEAPKPEDWQKLKRKLEKDNDR